MHFAWRSAAILACAALAAVGGAADAALAGTASGRPALFAAAAGERNAVTVDRTSGGEVQFSDAVTPILAGLFCLPIPLGQATCDPDGDARDMDGGGVSVDLGDRDDRMIVRGVPRSGGKGAPGRIVVLGGAGEDYLDNVASAVIRFEGGAGDDTLVSGVAATGVLIGGSGADVTASNALCCATSYEDHDRGVRVTLDGVPNDGAPDEQDDVQTSAVIGGPGADVITGDGATNALTGAGGADVLSGGAGDDAIDATVGFGQGTDAADTVTCGTGNDDVAAEAIDKVAVDCEQVRVGSSSGPAVLLGTAAVRAARSGSVALTYRAASPNPDPSGLARSAVALVDRKGRSASTSGALVPGADPNVARPRITLDRPTRRRLARSRSGKIVLIARRTYRDASAAAGYAQFNAPVTIRRAR